MIEILVDDQEWGQVFRYDENFKFGLVKAKMILAGLEKITEFCDNNGRYPPIQQKVVITDTAYRVLQGCIRYDEFIVRGRRIQKPFLKLLDVSKDFGFGLRMTWTQTLTFLAKVSVF